MDKYEIRKNIIIIALDNLINTYTEVLDFLNEEGFNQLNELNNEVIRMLVALIRSKNNGQLVNLNTDNSNIVTE